MAVTKRLLAQDDGDCQVLKLDSSQRYIMNSSPEWQMLLGPGSELSTSTQTLKLAAEFNQGSFDGIRLTAYLYNPRTGSVDSSSSCTFRVHVVRAPNWQDVLVDSFAGATTPNQYYFKQVLSSELPGVDLFGGDTLMIEAVVTRLGETYRDRVYVNHLGVYDNITRVRQDVEFLDITKLDE
jgi:hypothetical protein